MGIGSMYIAKPGEREMPDYVVTMESAWLIRDVKSLDDAIGSPSAKRGNG